MPAGRPTKFKEEYINQAFEACSRMGAEDKDLAALLDIAVSTLHKWQHDYPKFMEAIKSGKEIYDTKLVEGALRESAQGYSHPDTHISVVKGEVVQTPITKHYPPNPTSAIFWLKNRDPNRWRDKREVEGKLTLEGLHKELYGDE